MRTSNKPTIDELEAISAAPTPKESASLSDSPPVKGMKLIPIGLPLMFDAWFGCVIWAAGQEEHRNVFRKETGLSLDSVLKSSVLEAMIDKASGYEMHIVAAFCDWVTERLWGEKE